MKLTPPLVLALTLAVAGCGKKDDDQPAQGAKATSGDKGGKTAAKGPTRPKTTKMVAAIEPKNGSTVGGHVWFEQGKNASVMIQLTGLEPGLHGLQITETGDCSADDGSSAGEPYNPTGAKHGKPKSIEFMVGDLGNIAAAANGKAERIDSSTVIKLKGESSVAGRAVVVYAGPDDLRTHPRGNAGDIIGCGVIGPEK